MAPAAHYQHHQYRQQHHSTHTSVPDGSTNSPDSSCCPAANSFIMKASNSSQEMQPSRFASMSLIISVMLAASQGIWAACRTAAHSSSQAVHHAATQLTHEEDDGLWSMPCLWGKPGSKQHHCCMLACTFHRCSCQMVLLATVQGHSSCRRLRHCPHSS